MSGVSAPPDPATHAFRKDLADAALAGQVIASHYAEPLVRHILIDSPLRDAPSDTAPVIATVTIGDPFRMLDASLGWAWGYARSGRVGYVDLAAIGA